MSFLASFLVSRIFLLFILSYIFLFFSLLLDLLGALLSSFLLVRLCSARVLLSHVLILFGQFPLISWCLHNVAIKC